MWPAEDAELDDHVVRDVLDSVLPQEQQQVWDSCNRPESLALADSAVRVAGEFVGITVSEGKAGEDVNVNVNDPHRAVSIMTKNGDSKTIRAPQSAFVAYRRAQRLRSILGDGSGERMEIAAVAAEILEIAKSMISFKVCQAPSGA